MEIAAIKRYLSLFIFLIVISSCSDNNEDEMVNKPPSQFEVIVSTVSETSATINWNSSIDPEESTVFYDVYLNSVKLADNITDTSYNFEDLTENTNYTGEIIASDPEGNTISSPFIFETTNNQPPTLFEVTVTSTNPFYSRIEWTESTDPEGGSVTYNIYLGDELLAEGLSTLNYFFSELKGLSDYNVLIQASDFEGKTTEAGITFTTEIKIYDDDLLLSNQSQVETFGNAGYNQIDGNLNIGTLQQNLTDVVDLSPLESISVVHGNVSIRNTNCTNFNGLENISVTYPYAKLTIENNDQLQNCSGLGNISSIHEVYISDNDMLLSLNGLSSLNSVTNYMSIVFNPSLSSLMGLQNLNNVFNSLDISNNDSLTSLLGLEGITDSGTLSIIDNDSLESLNGLNNLSSCSSSLVIGNNDILQSLNGLSGLSYTDSLHITDSPMLTNLNGLENLTNVRHTLEIARNSGLITLNGIENINFSDNQANYHALIIWENTSITNLDPMTNYTFNRGIININYNSQLTNFCGITTLVSEIDDFINDYNFATNNGYNPSEMDILNGNCSI